MSLFLLLLAGAFSCNSRLSSDYDGPLPEKVDFNYHVSPILSDKCFACHGPDKNTLKADLRLDTKEGLLNQELKSGGHAFVPGNPRKSRALQRILSHDPETVMPPPESKLPALTDREAAIIARWIEQGAEYKPHWSFIPVEGPHIPDVREKEKVKNPIDNFVLKRLEENGLTFNEGADKEVLLRRVTLDLTGLPPTLEEIDAFMFDNSEDAYEKVVDRLLASPHYGERMALDWMDVARYADSHGYSQDGVREMWPWRDWVIAAFNDNMPYDQFITWQLAGDKLPGASKEQKLATGFLRNNRLNGEGGIVQEEFRMEYAFDRTETYGSAFLGMTLNCARCHDHKNDPISQEEYYGLLSFFNNINESGMAQNDGNSGPQVLVTTPRIDSLVMEIDAKIAGLEKNYRTLKKGPVPEVALSEQTDLSKGLIIDLSFEELEEKQLKNGVFPREKYSIRGDVEQIAGVKGNGTTFSGHDMIFVRDDALEFDRSDPFSISFWLNSDHGDEYTPVLDHLGSNVYSFPGYEVAVVEGFLSLRLIHALPANLIHVSVPGKLEKGRWAHYTLTYDGSGRAEGIKLYVNGHKTTPVVQFDQLTQSIRNQRKRLTIGGQQDYQQIIEGQGLLDELKIYDREISGIEAQAVFSSSGGKVVRQPEFRPEELKEHYFYTRSAEAARLREGLKALRAERNSMLDTVMGVMVMEDLEEMRPTYVLQRGVYDAPGALTVHGTPEAILSYGDDLPADRLGLARWTADRDNPLTSRVAVNRFWQMIFGRGLVKTTEDFGAQGEMPTHPLLLDWLAVGFMEQGWDVKALLKMMVTSATYRQSSAVSKAGWEKDPDNAMLARGPSHRLQAEIVRDVVLAASGTLTREIGGRSVRPYQPEGLWSEKGEFSKLKNYIQDTGKYLYKRGLYTFWRRSSPPPAMSIFDAPDRENCLVRRQPTNTPLQALALFNDPQYTEAARVLAEKLVGSIPDRRERIRKAWRLYTGRTPSVEIIRTLLSLESKQLERYLSDRESALALVSIGEWPVNMSLAPEDVAAMTMVNSTILSLDETIVKR